MNSELKVLVVDDNDIITKQISNYLQKAEVSEKIWRTNNGENTCKMIKENKPDLVLLNLKMPDMNGMDIIEKFKDEPIKFVIVSGFIDLEIMQKAKQFAVAALISKPFTFETFKTKIHEALEFDKTKVEDYYYNQYQEPKKKESLWKRLFRGRF